MRNFSGNSPIAGWTFLAMGLYFFLADRKRSVYGARRSEGEVVEGGVVESVRVQMCKGNLTDLRRILHLSLAKGNPKRTL
jgi:hypothetical protein